MSRVKVLLGASHSFEFILLFTANGELKLYIQLSRYSIKALVAAGFQTSVVPFKVHGFMNE